MPAALGPVRPQGAAAALLLAAAAAVVYTGWFTRNGDQQAVAVVAAVGLVPVAACVARLDGPTRVVALRGTLAWVRGYGRRYVEALPAFEGG